MQSARLSLWLALFGALIQLSAPVYGYLQTPRGNSEFARLGALPGFEHSICRGSRTPADGVPGETPAGDHITICLLCCAAAEQSPALLPLEPVVTAYDGFSGPMGRLAQDTLPPQAQRTSAQPRAPPSSI